jgi:iron(III) transport system substrate-binding protein
MRFNHVVAVAAFGAIALAACGASATASGTGNHAPASVAVHSGNTSLGTVLVSRSGLTLYGLMKDTNGTSSCNGACAQTWPPLLAEKGLLARYPSPQTKAYLEGFFDPKERWVSMYSNLTVLGYSTRQVSAAAAPKDWGDLLDARWNDKLGMDPELGIWYGAMLHYLGKERGEKFFKTLAQQKIHWRRGHSLLAQLMTAGEFPLAIVYAFNITQLQQSGAPAQWVTSAKPIVATSSGVGISAKTDAPASSKLFMDFGLSPEGQKLLVESGRFSGRKDLQTIKELKAFAVPDAVVLNLDRYLQEFKQLFNPRA